MFSYGNLWYRYLYYFTGTTHANSLLSWDRIDIDKDNYRSIAPRSRSYGTGAYGQDKMLNMSAIRDSAGRTGSWGYWWANSGAVVGLNTSQVTTLHARPSIFWDARRFDYATAGSPGDFTDQNNSNHFYSIWRLTGGSNIVEDIPNGNRGEILLNYNTGWDEQLFSINGQGKGNTSNGSPLSKVVLPAAYADFSASRPLLMSLTGGLPKTGGDVVNKNEPGDAWWRAGSYDYYLNYYSKYDGTSKKLLAKDDGMDWLGLESRTQIDGTQPLSELSASAESFVRGYSKVGEIAYI